MKGEIRILINGKEMKLSDITTDTSKPCGVSYAKYENGKRIYEK
jgi:hypothetical protein